MQGYTKQKCPGLDSIVENESSKRNMVEIKQSKKESENKSSNGVEIKKEDQRKNQVNNEHSRTLFIKGVTECKQNVNTEWLTHYFANTGLFDKMKIQDLECFETKVSKRSIVKVIMQNAEDVKTVLIKKSKLRKMDGFATIFIEQSLTWEERKKGFEQRLQNRMGKPEQGVLNASLNGQKPSWNQYLPMSNQPLNLNWKGPVRVPPNHYFQGQPRYTRLYPMKY
jgi:hypothetical protein